MTVIRAEPVHDYIRLQGEGGTLSIYNDWYPVPGAATLTSLVGTELLAAYEEPTIVVFVFDEIARLIVNLSNDAWHGREAMQIHRPGFPTVIWN